MSILLSDDINNEKLDFSYIKMNKHLSNPDFIKLLAVRSVKGSSYLEGINLPENFYLDCYEKTKQEFI